MTDSNLRPSRQGGFTSKLLAGMVAVMLMATLPALALDPRCEEHPERPQCQTTTTGGPGTPTTAPNTTTSVPEVTTTTLPPSTTSTTLAPTTTTTVPGPTTTTTPVPPIVDAISVIGCSNTNHAASGYLDLSTVDLLVNTAWAGHTIEYWATQPDGWVEHYLPLRPADGFDGAWLNLCERAENGLTLENAETVLAKIWEIDPGIPVWVSPLNYYEGEDCTVTAGNTIPDAGAVIADALASQYELVTRGPDLGPLTPDHLRADACHPNREGITFLGGQLLDFFEPSAG